MKENITEFLCEIFFVTIFISAVSIFVIVNRAIDDAIHIVKDSYNNERAIYEGHYKDEEQIVSGAHIISSIYLDLSYDIEVDGQSILKDTKVEDIEFSIINIDKDYQVIPEMVGGKIKKVVYCSVLN